MSKGFINTKDLTPEGRNELYGLIYGNIFHNVTDGKVCPVCGKDFKDIDLIIGFDNQPVHKDCWHVWLKQVWDTLKRVEALPEKWRTNAMNGLAELSTEEAKRWWSPIDDASVEMYKRDIEKADELRGALK